MNHLWFLVCDAMFVIEKCTLCTIKVRLKKRDDKPYLPAYSLQRMGTVQKHEPALQNAGEWPRAQDKVLIKKVRGKSELGQSWRLFFPDKLALELGQQKTIMTEQVGSL